MKAKNDDCTARGDRAVLAGMKHRGFTLVELMVVVVIVAVIMVIAVPGFSTLMERTRLKAYANEFVSSVYLARSEAIKRNADVTLCTSNDPNALCVSAAKWEDGWIVIDDSNQVIYRQPALNDGFLFFHMTSVSFDELVFTPNGLVSSVAAMKLCQNAPKDGIEEKEIIVSATGKPRVTTETNGCP